MRLGPLRPSSVVAVCGGSFRMLWFPHTVVSDSLQPHGLQHASVGLAKPTASSQGFISTCDATSFKRAVPWSAASLQGLPGLTFLLQVTLVPAPTALGVRVFRRLGIPWQAGPATFVSHSPESRHTPCGAVHAIAPASPECVRGPGPLGPATEQGLPGRCPGAAGRGSVGLRLQERFQPTFPGSGKEGEAVPGQCPTLASTGSG